MALFGNSPQTSEETITKERLPSAPPKLKPRVDQSLMSETAVAEYREVAKSIGISEQDMLVEEFRIFLAKNDLPVFNLNEVVSYMDDIAAKDNPTGLGWHWCPVRAKDAEAAMTFGRPSVEAYHSNGNQKTPSSDFYESHKFHAWNHGGFVSDGGIFWSGGGGNSHTQNVHVEANVRVMQEAYDEMFRVPPTPRDWRKEPSPAYTRTLPLHALKKIALIENHFKATKPIFLVTDYTIAPHVVINPDPFLMAVIPNSAVAHGKGRFIIDVWDEPGFGIERMLK